MISSFKNKIAILLGKTPDCAWTRDRFGAYYVWHQSLSRREFLAIEQHLIGCQKCAAEYKLVHDASNAIEKKLAEADPRMISAEELLEQTMARIHASKAKETISTRKRPIFRKKAAWMAATTCLFIIAAPVLASIGVKLFQACQPLAKITDDIVINQIQEDGEAITSQEATTVIPETIKPNANDGMLFDETFILEIDDQLKFVVELAFVELMLPRTEEQYEQWACKEYPHIMWLYYLLTEDTDNIDNKKLSPRFSLEGAWGNPSFSQKKGSPIWNSTPTNIPEWAQKLYADTPESERPTGWRAMLIYSGEIFKLDYPTSLEEPNCKPTIEAIQAAAAVAGYAMDFNNNGQYKLPNLDSTEDEIQQSMFDLVKSEQTYPSAIPEKEIPDRYTKMLASNTPQAKSVLIYLSVSFQLPDKPGLQELSDACKSALVEFCETSSTECNVSARISELSKSLDSREELLGLIRLKEK